jgi:DNA mismatch repair ATPase MutS
MAGKSTFLRTVSLGLVMANTGLPVCAKEMLYSPIKLITSMRTADSLSEESSYFYAEIMRLRFIVDQMKEEKYFIILDEILKGTNSKDKAIGSRKFVEKLVKSGSTGIIATHDLSLCEIEKIYPQIHNQYFDAKIQNEELYFDYKLKEGICTNMNASFLLRKMDII